MLGEGEIPLVCWGKDFGPAVLRRAPPRNFGLPAATVAVLTSACAPGADRIAGEEGGAWEG